jgi:hypothetical protein
MKICLFLISLSCLGADPSRGAGHGRNSLTRAVSTLPPSQPQVMPFEPHPLFFENNVVRQMSVKVTMRQKRNSPDIRIRVEVFIRDRMVLRHLVDLIQEETSEDK